VVAAKRLVARILSEYPRLIDVITADAIYLEAPFIRMIVEAGKHVIVVMKQEARDLYKDAEGLRSVIKPRTIQDGARTSRIWDIPHLSSFTTPGQPVRVVWAEEKTVTKKVTPKSKPRQTTEKQSKQPGYGLPPLVRRYRPPRFSSGDTTVGISKTELSMNWLPTGI